MKKVKIEDIKKASDQLEKIGNNNHELFVKALFMYLRGIEDEETLDKMWKTYDRHDISLIHDLILEDTF